jgi:acetyl-CoA synthetase
MTSTPGLPENYWLHRRTAAHRQYRQARDLLLRLRTDHESAVQQFDWPRPAEFNWALEWFDVLAHEPDTAERPALALWDGERLHDYGFRLLSQRSDQVAVWLRSVGVRRGDRLLVVLRSQLELWEVILAAIKLGAVVVPAYPHLSADEAADRVRRGRIDQVICADDLADRLEGALADALADGIDPVGRIAVPGTPSRPAGWLSYAQSYQAAHHYLPEQATAAGDLAFGYFTSGTTARPKLVGHTHTSYPIGHLSSLYWNGLLPGDRHYNAAGPGWAKHSWSSFFVPWTAGATVVSVIGDQPAPASLPRLLERVAANSFCAPPSTWRALLATLAEGRPGLREATCAGEPLTLEAAAAVRAAWQVDVRDGYGQTECTAVIGTTPGLRPRPGMVGRRLPGYHPRIEDGELVLPLSPRPAGLMAGYLGDDEKTATAVAGGVYRTGDAAEAGDDGWFRLTGRRDDVFKSFDRRISPHEVEAVLRTHPAVRDVAVLGAPHQIGGSVPHAVVVLADQSGPSDRSEVTAGALTAHLEARLPGLWLESMDVVSVLPRTASGKVRRAQLRAERWPVLATGFPETYRHPHQREGMTMSTPTDQTSTMAASAIPTSAPGPYRVLRTIFGPGLAEHLDLTPLTVDGRKGVSVDYLYGVRDDPDGPACGIARYEPGAVTPLHRHESFELIIVLEGELRTEHGRYGPGDLLVMPPNSEHSPHSEKGCLTLVVWERPVTPIAGIEPSGQGGQKVDTPDPA